MTNILIKFNYKTKRNNLLEVKTTYQQILKCFMMSGQSRHVARAAYHCLLTLTNPDMLDQVKPTNISCLERQLGELSLDHDKGVVQHKTAFMRHMLNHPLNPREIYNISKYRTLIEVPSNAVVRPAVMNEVPILEEYLHNYNSNISKVIATCDTMPGVFPGQKQTNQDFWVMPNAKAISFGTVVDQALGLKARSVIPQDEKSGMDMFQHSTRGSLGLLTYDSDGNNIQVTSHPVNSLNIVNYNHKRLQGLLLHSKTLGIKPIEDTINKCIDLNDALEKSSDFLKVSHMHEKIQNILWNDIQLHSQFDRSVSFVFLKQVEYGPPSDKLQAFQQRFTSMLGDKVYDLNERGECRAVYKAMLIAYYQTVDKGIIKKLSYLQHDIGVGFNKNFLADLAQILREGLL